MKAPERLEPVRVGTDDAYALFYSMDFVALEPSLVSRYRCRCSTLDFLKAGHLSRKLNRGYELMRNKLNGQQNGESHRSQTSESEVYRTGALAIISHEAIPESVKSRT